MAFGKVSEGGVRENLRIWARIQTLLANNRERSLARRLAFRGLKDASVIALLLVRREREARAWRRRLALDRLVSLVPQEAPQPTLFGPLVAARVCSC